MKCDYCDEANKALATVDTMNLTLCKDCWEIVKELSTEAIECIEKREEGDLPHLYEQFFR